MIKREKLIGKLRTWISEDTAKGAVKLLVLRFYHSKPGEEEIESYIVRDGNTRKIKKDVESFADEIIADCEEQAEGVGGLVRYRLFAYAGDGNERFVASTVLKVFSPVHEDTEESGDSADPQMSEKPTTQGSRSQEMRHYEAMFRMMVNGIEMTMGKLRAENDDLRVHNDKMASKIISVIDVVENARSQSKLREIMEQNQLNKSKVTGALVEKANILIPHFVNKLMGGPVMPTKGKPPEVEAIRATLHSLKPEQWGAIFGTLDEAQRQPLMKLAEDMIREEEEEKARIAATLASATPSPKQLKPKPKEDPAAAE